MALNKEAQKKVLKALSFPEAEIAKLTGDDEVDVTVPEGKFYNNDDLAELETNLKEEGKGENIKAGKEIMIKDLKKELGLDYDGKDPKTFVAKAKEFILKDAQKPESEALRALEADKIALQDTLKEKETELSNLMRDKETLSYNNTLLSKLPAKRNTDIQDDLHLLNINAKLVRKVVDGKESFELDGVLLQDDKRNNLSLEAAIGKFYEKYPAFAAKETPAPAGPKGRGGAGSGDNPNFYNSMAEVQQAMKEKGINPISKEGREFVANAREANKEMDANPATT